MVDVEVDVSVSGSVSISGRCRGRCGTVRQMTIGQARELVRAPIRPRLLVFFLIILSFSLTFYFFLIILSFSLALAKTPSLLSHHSFFLTSILFLSYNSFPKLFIPSLLSNLTTGQTRERACSCSS